MTSRTLKLTIEYDGTEFVGWQVQHNGRSVQAELERALERILREKTTVVGAGRTDAGVHARAQVAHCHISSSTDLPHLQHSLNGILPEDIAVTALEEVPETFHARYDAIERRYKYYVTCRRSPLDRRHEWWVKYRLDMEKLNAACALIAGEHDFSSFCRTKAEVNHHRCTVNFARWTIEDHRLVFDISADRFLHGMVRTLVGTMIDVARGFISIDDFSRILERRDRRSAGIAAPPQGLVLWEITYKDRR